MAWLLHGGIRLSLWHQNIDVTGSCPLSHHPPILSKSWQQKSANVARKVKNHYFSIKYHELEKKVVPLQSHLPMTAMMSTEVYGAVGWRHYIIEGVTDALFLVFETSTID